MSYHEQCYCPVKNVSEWVSNMNCPTSIHQIHSDLSIFPRVDFRTVAEELVSRFGQSPRSVAISHYVVKNNKVSVCRGVLLQETESTPVPIGEFQKRHPRNC